MADFFGFGFSELFSLSKLGLRYHNHYVYNIYSVKNFFPYPILDITITLHVEKTLSLYPWHCRAKQTHPLTGSNKLREANKG